MFSENSMVVRVWVNNVKSGAYTRSQVPALSNLRDVVLSALGPE